MTTLPADSPARLARLIATGKVKLARAIDLLLRTHPFHGHVAAGWRARPDPSAGTMGVYWACGGVQLVWNPEFVDQISEPQLAAVIAHETHHIVLRHPFLFPEQADPPPDFDAFAAMVAEEVTVNEFITLPLPGDPLRLQDFAKDCPGLQPLQSTRERYRTLYDPARARRAHAERKKLEKSLEKQIQEQLEHLLSGRGDGQIGPVLIDTHAGWGSFQRGGAAAALAVSVATAQAMAKHGRGLSSKLRALINRAHGTLGGHGSTPGGMLETLAGTARARLPWQTILRQLLAVDHEREHSYMRPPRRFPELVGVLPGTRRVPKKLKLLAAIDTSGSMDASTLDEIAAELRAMARAYDVSVVEFDATIQRRYRLCQSAAAAGESDPLSAMQGRGGTNFHPIFEPDSLAWAADGGDLSGVVVFTDGFGPAPDEPPREEVIWVLMGPGVRQPAEWGRIVRASSPA